MATELDPIILETLACPVCQGKLQLVKDGWIACTSCDRQYPVVDEIPVLIPERARLD